MRKFVDLGLAVYLDNERVNIFKKESNEIFLSGIYRKPYWLIELKSKDKLNCREHRESKQILVNLASDENCDSDFRYQTRSVSKILQERSKIENSSAESEVLENTDLPHIDSVDPDKTDITVEMRNDFNESNSEESERLNEKESNSENVRKILYEKSNFDTTIWDREC